MSHLISIQKEVTRKFQGLGVGARHWAKTASGAPRASAFPVGVWKSPWGFLSSPPLSSPPRTLDLPSPSASVSLPSSSVLSPGCQRQSVHCGHVLSWVQRSSHCRCTCSGPSVCAQLQQQQATRARNLCVHSHEMATGLRDVQNRWAPTTLWCVSHWQL